MINLAYEYERDFYSWIDHNINLLKQRRLTELDIDTLIEELESLAKRDRHELVSHLIILIAHLLKWQFQLKQLTELWQTPQGSSWRRSIQEQRVQLARQLRMSPSLKPYIPKAIQEAYADAVRLAVDETGLPTATFPQTCPYTITQLLDDHFYPEFE